MTLAGLGIVQNIIFSKYLLSEGFRVCREKELLKEKRRKRQELFQEQKVSLGSLNTFKLFKQNGKKCGLKFNCGQNFHLPH